MGIMQFDIPDDVKEAFEAAVPGEQADALVAEFLRKAAAERARPKAPGAFTELVRQAHAMNTRVYTDEEVREAREAGRP